MNQDNKNNEGIDLSGALKDSGTGVKLEEYRTPRLYYSDTPKIIQWVMKYSGGLVKDEKQASYVLLGFVVAAIIVSLILIFSMNGRGTTSQEEIEQLIREAPPPKLVEPELIQ